MHAQLGLDLVESDSTPVEARPMSYIEVDFETLLLSQLCLLHHLAQYLLKLRCLCWVDSLRRTYLGSQERVSPTSNLKVEQPA